MSENEPRDGHDLAEETEISSSRTTSTTGLTPTAYETIFNEAEDAIFVFDVSHDGDEVMFTFQENNPAHESITGMTTEEHRGQLPQDFLNEEQAAEVTAHYRTCVKGQETIEYEETLEHPSGTVEWSTKLTPIIEGETVIQILGISRDITKRKEHEQELKFYEQIIDTVNDIATVIDSEGEITFVSPTVQDVLGYKPEDLVGQNGFEYQPPETVDAVQEAIEYVIEHPDESKTVQTKFRRSDGSFCWIESTIQNQLENDLIEGLVVNSRDISERKEYERKLKESKEQLTEQNTALESFAEIVTDSERTVDQQITDLLGFGTTSLDLDVGVLAEIDGSEYMVRNIIDPTESINPGDTFDLADTYCSFVYETDGPVSFHSASEGGVKDHAAYKKHGMESFVGVPVLVNDQRYGTLNFSQSEAREGEITATEESFVRIMAQWIGTALARQQRQEELEQLSRFLQETQEVAKVGGWEVSLVSEKLRWSEQVYHIHGLPLDASLTIEEGIEFYHPDDRDTIRDAFDRVTADGEPYDLELRIVTADDEVRWVRTRGEPLYEEGEIVAVHGTFQDISERKEYEQQLTEQRDNLELLNQVVRHDIRNNLQVIQGRTGLLEEHVDESGQEHIDPVQKNTKNAIELTKTARDLNETMLSTEADVESVRLDQHLDSVIENARSEFDAIITVEDSIPNSIVSGNELLEAVFRNLIQNAVVHSDKETPQIELSVTVADETLTVAVADNGPGIPDNQKEEIFGKGEKGLDSPGTGIGLYLVQTLVDQYGGGVWVKDNEPDGSVFVVELPRADAEQG